MRAPPTSLAASLTSCARARDQRRRPNGRPRACAAASASRRATTASTRAFMLAMARVAMAKSQHKLPERRRQGLTRFRAHPSRDVTILSRLQLDGEVLERLGQKTASAAIPAEAPDFGVLYRLQCAQDAAYRAAGARYHGCARRHLSGNGWANPLLRHPSVKYRRRRNVRPYGLELDRKDVALEVRPGDLVVPELLRPVHGSHDLQPSNGNVDRGHSR